MGAVLRNGPLTQTLSPRQCGARGCLGRVGVDTPQGWLVLVSEWSDPTKSPGIDAVRGEGSIGVVWAWLRELSPSPPPSPRSAAGRGGARAALELVCELNPSPRPSPHSAAGRRGARVALELVCELGPSPRPSPRRSAERGICWGCVGVGSQGAMDTPQGWLVLAGKWSGPTKLPRPALLGGERVGVRGSVRLLDRSDQLRANRFQHHVGAGVGALCDTSWRRPRVK
jgi:hypothetical protein